MKKIIVTTSMAPEKEYCCQQIYCRELNSLKCAVKQGNGKYNRQDCSIHLFTRITVVDDVCRFVDYIKAHSYKKRERLIKGAF